MPLLILTVRSTALPEVLRTVWGHRKSLALLWLAVPRLILFNGLRLKVESCVRVCASGTFLQSVTTLSVSRWTAVLLISLHRTARNTDTILRTLGYLLSDSIFGSCVSVLGAATGLSDGTRRMAVRGEAGRK